MSSKIDRPCSQEKEKEKKELEEKKEEKEKKELEEKKKEKEKKELEEKKEGKEEEYEFFYGNKSPFSQHHPASFCVEGVRYNCAEQYMMHQKAVLFKDDTMAKRIMQSSNPVEQKRFGRKVQHFDKDVWTQKSVEVVKTANLAKFSQNPALLSTLLSTHPRTLAEASPRDRLWGIGLGASNPKARNRSLWRGRNLLGHILTEVREQLRREKEEEEEEEKKEEEEKEEEEDNEERGGGGRGGEGK